MLQLEKINTFLRQEVEREKKKIHQQADDFYNIFTVSLQHFYNIFSVHLARRVLQLEKINTSLRQEVEREKKKIHQLADEVGFVSVCLFLLALIQNFMKYNQ